LFLLEDLATTEAAITFTGQSGASESVELTNIGNLFLQLGRTQGGVSDTYTLGIAADSTNSTFNALLSWHQII
jgi:hypothetical protein